MTTRKRRANWALAVAGGVVLSWFWSVQPPLVETTDHSAKDAIPTWAEVSKSEETESTSQIRPFLPDDGLAGLSKVAEDPALSSGNEIPGITEPVSLDPSLKVSQGYTDIPGAVWFSGTIEMDESADAPTSSCPDEQ